MDSTENTKSGVARREEETLKFWQENKIFEKTLEKPADLGEFVFYDGPPFATGLPHYGHILASTIKDVIPRYKTMQGFHVPRRWGWDCHGLPIENIVEKELGFKHKKDIKEYGIEKFNEKCREQVLMYAHEWEKIIPRMGRFVDMKNAYHTMDETFMESVWWMFKQLYDKGLIYEDYRSMHICPRCETTLSQQEVSEGYKDVKDIAVTVKFKIKGVDNGYFLAWTTTPWTLPGNVALAVGKDITYVEARVGDEILVLAKDRLSTLTESYEVIAEHKGSEMVGMEYEPPFDYYIKDTTLKNYENGWKVYAADFITAESGTGIAHEAPAFGAEDFELSKQVNLPFVQHVNYDGTMKPEVTDFAGLEVKPKSDDDKVRLGTDIAILKYLQDHGAFFSKENITHAYPHCWRCDTPLLNYATSSWFMSVTKIKETLLKNAELINWSPEHIKEGRFGKWLQDARDWSISRQRFWASAIPLWADSSGSYRAIGGVDELKKLTKKSGNKYFIIRHGESEHNVKNILSSYKEDNWHITEKGKQQVRESAEALKSKGITKIISSPFVRAKETTEIIKRVLGISPENISFDDRLGEHNLGVLSGGPIQAYHDMVTTNEMIYDLRPQGGENLADVKKRSGELLYEVDKKYSNENILLVTHEHSTWGLESAARGLDKKGTVSLGKEREKYIMNAELREVDFVPLPHNQNYELDLHKPYIDEITLVDENGEKLTRVNDVLDTWFDSGSMPYGEWHYPYENKEKFEAFFPARFIAEGIDQTRAWFYYLHVLAGGLFEKNAFQNAIVNGVVLAEDGKKMSKKLQNYPDPMTIVDIYGADALRFYLLSSPVVQAENLGFSEKGVDEVYKKVILKLGNVISFYDLYATGKGENSKPNVLDRWILSRLAQLQQTVTKHLDAYELDRASRPILDFVDDLSTWYIRRSRERFKSDNEQDKHAALYHTRHVLLELSKIIAPFMPFLAEDIYQKVKSESDPESVHLCQWAKGVEVEQNLLDEMEKVRKTVTVVLEARSKAGIRVRQPLASLAVKENLTPELRTILAEEVNVKEVVSDESLESPFELDITVTPELKAEGNVRDFIRAVQDARKNANLTPSQIITLKVETDEAGKNFVESNAEAIKKPTNVGGFEFVQNGGGEFEVENLKFKISV